MPYKSQAQRRKFYAMLGAGEISAETVKYWDRESKGKKLPEKVATEWRGSVPRLKKKMREIEKDKIKNRPQQFIRELANRKKGQYKKP